ncbi:MAG: RhuM family protein, partial [Candidatus Pacebacteria bacterium]|nr:RhuM family protein [Candidatus Paceibacterota bacterium]
MKKENIIIYQAENGEIRLRADFKKENIWATQAQIGELFDIERSVVTKHIKNILRDNEVDTKSNVQKMHITNSDKLVYIYSLDIILAVGYRAKSTKAIYFRKWVTKTLKEHIVKGYTINKKQLKNNYEQFLKDVENIKSISLGKVNIKADDVLELVKIFASTWFSLDAYDKESFSKKGFTKKTINVEAKELYADIFKLKDDLIEKGEAT